MRLKSLALAMATIGSLLVATASQAYHDDGRSMGYKGCPTPMCGPGGWYVGGTVGIKSITSDTDVDVGFDVEDSAFFAEPFIATLDSDLDSGSLGGSATLYVGYGMNLQNNFYLGFEASAEFNNINVEDETTLNVDPFIDGYITMLETELQVQDSLGLALLPGIRLSDCSLIYGRLGVVWGRIHSEIEGIFGDDDDTFTKIGGQVGFGMEYALNRQLSIRAEYVYTWYQEVETDVDTSLGGFIVDSEESNAVDLFASLEQTIRTSAVNIGLTYRFA